MGHHGPPNVDHFAKTDQGVNSAPRNQTVSFPSVTVCVQTVLTLTLKDLIWAVSLLPTRAD